MKTLLIVMAVLLSGAAAEACPGKPQNIKVIDLKSGWWQGDGGDTDQYVIRHVTTECPGVKFFYEHSLGYGGGGFGFGPKRPAPPKDDPNDYDQIWLLSGGEADGVDLRIESAEFQKYLKQMTEGRGNLFVGTGFGNVYHANALTRALGLGDLAVTHRVVAEFPSPYGVTMQNELGLEKLARVPLFEGLFSLPHLVKLGEFIPPSDELTGVTALATDADGKTVIGEVEVGARKLVMDANLARTYLIRNADRNIGKYLVNLATVLER